MGDILGGENTAAPFILYLNADNPTIQQMAQMVINPATDLEVYRSAILAIYNNAALRAQYFLTPDSAQAIWYAFWISDEWVRNEKTTRRPRISWAKGAYLKN